MEKYQVTCEMSRHFDRSRTNYLKLLCRKPMFSNDKIKLHLGNNPYCIIEMDNYQRQTTPVLCDTSKLQWNVSFRFLICDINNDMIKCSIYNRSKYTTDRKILSIDFRFYFVLLGLLGSVEIPLTFLTERCVGQEDCSSMYSLATSNFSEMSSLNWKTRTCYLQHSSNNSQISLKYLVCLNE